MKCVQNDLFHYNTASETIEASNLILKNHVFIYKNQKIMHIIVYEFSHISYSSLFIQWHSKYFIYNLFLIKNNNTRLAYTYYVAVG